MMNSILCGTEIVDKLAESGIVVLIGVSMVFLLLFLLIGVVKLLRYLDFGLVKWDGMMKIYRDHKAARKAIKKSYIDIRDEKINEVYKKMEKGELDNKQAKQAIKEIKEDFNQNDKPNMVADIAKLKEEQKAENVARKLAKKGEGTTTTSPAVQSEDGEMVTDERLIAVISAAIAVATEQECAERKVKFKVRTIKCIK